MRHKLLFICGSLESGCNGVGDYTRILAAQLMRLGHEVRLVALHDYAVNGQVREVQDGMVCCRLSAELAWAERTRCWIDIITEFQPDVVSLQFVPFSFHHKGIPIAFNGSLKRVLRAVESSGSQPRWQIMFHETWLGVSRSDRVKHRLVGGLQRWLAIRMVRLARPVAVHTSNAFYIEVLRRTGISAHRLPLFSNFHGVVPDSDWAANQLTLAGITKTNRRDWRVIIFLGKIARSTQVARIIASEANVARNAGVRLAVIGVGGGAGTDEAFKSAVLAHISKAGIFIQLGRLSPERVMGVLAQGDIGIPVSPRELLGKSGVAAAMQEAGLRMTVYHSLDLPDFTNYAGAELPIGESFSDPENVALRFLADCGFPTACDHSA